MAFSLTKQCDPDLRITLDPQATYIDVSYTMGNRNINTIVLNLKFVKDVADFTIQARFSSAKAHPTTGVVYNTNKYKECYADASGVVKANVLQIIDGTDNYRILYNPIKDEDTIVFRITPTNMVGNDTLTVDIRENCLGS